MKPEHLHAWQPHTNTQQLRRFIEEHPSLFALLDEAWEKFEATYPALSMPVSPASSPYAANITPEQLEHHPISDAELVEFLQLFDQQHARKDRPFGDNPHIQEPNWTLCDH